MMALQQVNGDYSLKLKHVYDARNTQVLPTQFVQTESKDNNILSLTHACLYSNGDTASWNSPFLGIAYLCYFFLELK